VTNLDIEVIRGLEHQSKSGLSLAGTTTLGILMGIKITDNHGYMVPSLTSPFRISAYWSTFSAAYIGMTTLDNDEIQLEGNIFDSRLAHPSGAIDRRAALFCTYQKQ